MLIYWQILAFVAGLILIWMGTYLIGQGEKIAWFSPIHFILGLGLIIWMIYLWTAPPSPYALWDEVLDAMERDDAKRTITVHDVSRDPKMIFTIPWWNVPSDSLELWRKTAEEEIRLIEKEWNVEKVESITFKSVEAGFIVRATVEFKGTKSAVASTGSVELKREQFPEDPTTVRQYLRHALIDKR